MPPLESPSPQTPTSQPTLDEPRSRKPSRARAASADAATPGELASPSAQINIDWSESATNTLKTHAWQRAQERAESNRYLGHRAIFNASNGAKRSHNLIVRQTVKRVLGAAKSLYPALQMQLESIGNPLWELDIAFTDDAAMQALNAEHRGKNKPTDVLSFPVWEGDYVFPLPPGETNVMLGDIIISIDTAIRQAQELKHDLCDEIAFLAAHGSLHLLGYDHGTDTQRRVMFALQDAIVAQLREAKGF